MVRWNQEDIKLEILVDNGEPYVVETDDEANERRLIYSATVSATDNNSSNPFGICGSRSYNFIITDLDDYLSATNTESPYYNKIRTGSKVKVYLKDTETNEWKNDGTYFISSINGGFSEGYYNETSLSCQDKLDNIGSKSNPKIPCLRNIKVKDFINYLLTDLTYGIDWDIDEELGNKVLLYGLTVGEKVRDTLNALAQFLQARITINRDNVITIRSATKIYGKTYKIPYDLVQSLSNSYSSYTNYSKLTISYNVDGFKVSDVLLNDNGYTFKSGINVPVDSLKFLTKALSINNISIVYDRKMYDSTARIVGYYGHQDGLENLTIAIEGEDINSCTIYAEGASIDKSTRQEEKVIYTSDENGLSINIDIKYIIRQDEAQALLANLANLVEKMNKQIVIKTIASPFIDNGDEIILEDEDYPVSYRGKYRVIKYQTTHGLDYNNILTLIKE